MEWKKIRNHEIWLSNKWKIEKLGDGYGLFKKYKEDDNNDYYEQVAFSTCKEKLFDKFDSNSTHDDIVLCEDRPTYA